MKKLKQNVNNTIIINKSKFITTLIPVETIDEVNEALKQIKKNYYDATHNCYAYILDNGLIQKCSDDGEPAKTAGAPILDVLKKNDVTNILAIVTRYFGGIKLGAGGLTRAYSQSASEAIKLASFMVSEDLYIYKIEADYQTYNRLAETLKGVKIIDQNFLDTVTIKIGIKNQSDIEQIKNLALGKVNIIYLGVTQEDIDL